MSGLRGGVVLVLSLAIPGMWRMFASSGALCGTGAPLPARAAPTGTQAAATASTVIKVEGAESGPVFGGVAGISGGSGNSRRLLDYPAAQRDHILDYLFNSGMGHRCRFPCAEAGIGNGP